MFIVQRPHINRIQVYASNSVRGECTSDLRSVLRGVVDGLINEHPAGEGHRLTVERRPAEDLFAA